MSTIKSYIYVGNHIPKEVCEALIDECNKKIWEKHKTIFHTFYDHLLLRTLFNDCNNKTEEWKNYDPIKQREKLIKIT